MSRWKVISTRRLDAVMSGRIRENNIELLEENFIVAQAVGGLELHQVSLNDKAVVFTSANAVSAVSATSEELTEERFTVFCLSGKTKQAVVENFPNGNILETANDATALAEKIIEHGLKTVIFFCGNARRDELPATLRRANISVEEIIVYETAETPVKINNAVDAVMFFSASAVRSFFAVNTLKPETICFSIGKTTADEIQKYTGNKTIISQQPTQEAMAEAIINYFKPTVRP